VRQTSTAAGAHARKEAESQPAELTAPQEDPPASAAVQQVDQIAGKVLSVGKIVDAQTGNLPVRILLDNPRGQLAIGQTLEVAITVAEGATVLAVPAEAVFDLGEGSIVCVVRDHASHQLHVEAGQPREGWTPVTGSDLRPGEPVITKGGFNLPDDTEVTIEPEAGASSEPAEAT
jgi:multidrug efflux pump subunit AcrA (membrane-fusion protein)